MIPSKRKLDVIIPSFNRPARLYSLLKSGLSLDVPSMFFVVIDDASTVREQIDGNGEMSTKEVCESFASSNVLYFRNAKNMGVAESWVEYYKNNCDADYTLSVTDKDEFINARPIVNALTKMDDDPSINLVVIPLRQRDRAHEDRSLSFDYHRMTGAEYLVRYVEDNTLKHCSMWGIVRVDAIRKAGVPRSMGLRKFGLDDGFGIDIDLIMNIVASGDVDFENEEHVRRSTIAGGTEKFPLTFAYTYYQYAMRVMDELSGSGVISNTTKKAYLKFWLLLILRGLNVAYNPVHGSELELGTSRIQGHLKRQIHFYVFEECYKFRIFPSAEMWSLILRTAKQWLFK